MPLLKSQKVDLAQTYLDKLQKGLNVTLLAFDKIPVNEVNKFRMDVADAQWALQVVKKRVFLKIASWAFGGFTLDQAEGSVMLLYSYNQDDMYAPLKVVNKYVKLWAKEKKEYSISYIGGWFDKEWKLASWVQEMATLPSKEELVWKLLFLLNHPVSSLARAFQAIADKKAE